MARLQDPREHDDLLNYRLKRLVALGGAPAIRLCEGEFGVARSEWRLVAALVESGPMSPTELSVRSGFEQGRCSRLAATLLDKRLVARLAVPGERHRARLTVTPDGERLYAGLFPQLATINRRLVSVLTDDEADCLERCLDKLTAKAAAVFEEGGGIEARTNRRLGGRSRRRPSFHGPSI